MLALRFDVLGGLLLRLLGLLSLEIFKDAVSFVVVVLAVFVETVKVITIIFVIFIVVVFPIIIDTEEEYDTTSVGKGGGVESKSGEG